MKISKEFAYILGVIYGDGSLRLKEFDGVRSSGVITLKVKDKDFALYFKKIIEKWSGLRAKYWLDKRDFYNTCLYSIDACRIIDKFNMNNILAWNKDFQCEFLKGLFDSDGGVVVNGLTNRKYAKRWIHLSNNNVQLIKLTKCLFDKMNIRHSVSKRIHSGFGSKKLQYEIKIYNFDGISKYYKNIGFSIKRKQLKLRELVNSYDFGIDLYNR